MGGLTDKGEEETRSTNSVGPPDWARGYVQNFASDIPAIQNTFLTPYGGSMTADISPERNAGLTGVYDLASRGGTGLGAVGQGYIEDVLGGKYLDATHLANASRSAIDRFVPRHNSAWALAGRDNSGLAADALGEGVTRAVSDAYFRERGMQQGALGFIPQMDNLAYSPFYRMMDVGRAREADIQADIEEDRYRHDFLQNEPFTRMNRTGNLLGRAGSLWGSEGMATQVTPGQSPLQSIAGLGLTAAGIYSGNPAAFIGGASRIAGGGGASSAAAASQMWNPYSANPSMGWGGVPWT